MIMLPAPTREAGGAWFGQPLNFVASCAGQYTALW